MSKIVIMNNVLCTPRLINELIARIAVRDPFKANSIAELNTLPIIRECVENALGWLSQSGVRRSEAIEDYFGNVYNGKLDGAIKTDKLSHGLGVRIAADGKIEFVGDEYTQDWKNEIKRLSGLFTDAFMAEINQSILQIIGYPTTIEAVSLGSGEIAYRVKGVKA